MKPKAIIPMFFCILAVVCGSAFAPSFLFAQSPESQLLPANPVERQVQTLNTVLGLSTDQEQQARNIFSTEVTADTNVLANLKAARNGLLDAMQNNDLDKMKDVSAAMGALTGQVIYNEAVADASFYQLLSPAQQDKLKAYFSKNLGFWGSFLGGQ